MTQNLVESAPTETKNQTSPLLFSVARRIWKNIAPKLTSVVNITALLTIAGFFVIQSYLTSVSSLFTFNINVTQYLATGVNLILGVLWYLIIPSIGYIFFFLVIFSLILIVFYLINKYYSIKIKFIQKLKVNFLAPILRLILRVFQLIHSILVVIIIISLTLVYGRFYYPQSPRIFGGGMPANVILIFQEPQSTQNSIWGFSINSVNPHQSEPVELLIELTDGLIIRNPSTQTIVIVKNDAIQGIIDISSAVNNTTNILSTPTPAIIIPTP